MKKKTNQSIRSIVIVVVFEIAFLLALGSLVICVMGTTTTRHTLSEAKNAEFALRLLATEYYGKDQRVYDPLSPDGLAGGVAEEVAQLSGAEGELVLGSWDAERRAPRSFVYTKDKIAVVYNYDEQSGHAWKLYYLFRKASLPKWSIQTESPAAE